MNYRLKELRTISEAHVSKLEKGGFSTASQLLAKGATPDERKALAAHLDLSDDEILTLVNRADLSRIKGVGPVYSDLLEYSGVDTVIELAKRVPEHLHAKLLEKSVAHATKRAPRLHDVESWVDQAKKLDRKVSY